MGGSSMMVIFLFEDWQKLQEGKEAELKSLPESIEHLFDAPKSQKKGAK